MKSKKPSLYDAQEEQIQLQSASFVDSVLYLTSRLFYGRLQNHEYRVQILVQNGWFPTAAPCHERLVPSWFCLVHGTVHRKRWCADHR